MIGDGGDPGGEKALEQIFAVPVGNDERSGAVSGRVSAGLRRRPKIDPREVGGRKRDGG